MKKLVLVLVLLLASAALFAQTVDLSALPTGRWLDHNFDAIWEFGASGIKLSTPTDGDIFTFTTGNIQNLRAVRSGVSAGIGFSCNATGRTYSFIPNLADGSMTMSIERDGLPNYQVVMQRHRTGG